ncbi:MAG: glycoside hydrolase family 2 TIM barrel-domain containing protein, partial [bacterium]
MSRTIEAVVIIAVLLLLLSSMLIYRASPAPPLDVEIVPLETSGGFPSPFRGYKSLNGEWTVRAGGGDRTWSVPVPGVWDVPPPAAVPELVYTRGFRLAKEWKGKNVRLCFGRIFGKVSPVVNGRRGAGASAWGLPVSLDVTPFVTFDTPNLLELRVAPPAGGRFPLNFRGWRPEAGIHGDVFLEAVPGTWIESLRIDAGVTAGGEGRLGLRVRFGGEAPDGAMLMGQVRDPEGKRALSFEEYLLPDMDVWENGMEMSLTLKGAVEWSPESPRLYRLDLVLVLPGAMDGVSSRFGFRDFRVSGKGFVLNGKEVRLDGVNYYTDSGAAPRASVEIMKRDLLAIREMGWNAVRFFPAPVSREALDECDRLGLMALAELPTGFIPPAELSKSGVVSYVQGQFKTLMEVFGNHPSFVMAGIGGSLDAEDSRVRTFVKRVADFTALVGDVPVYAGAARSGGERFAGALPVIAVNCVRSASGAGGFAEAGAVDVVRAGRKGKPVVVISYGAPPGGGRWTSGRGRAAEIEKRRSSPGGGVFAAGRFFHSYADYPDMRAVFSPVPYMNLSGLFTRDRREKPVLYYVEWGKRLPVGAYPAPGATRGGGSPRAGAPLEPVALALSVVTGFILLFVTGGVKPAVLGVYETGAGAADGRVAVRSAAEVHWWMTLRDGARGGGTAAVALPGAVIFIGCAAAVSLAARLSLTKWQGAVSFDGEWVTPVVGVFGSSWGMFHAALVFTAFAVGVSSLVAAMIVRAGAFTIAPALCRALTPFLFVPAAVWAGVPVLTASAPFWA